MDWQDRQPETRDTDIDEAIRLALRQRVSAAEPPDRVWQRLRSQVAPGSPRQRRRVQPRNISRLFAPIVQGLVATSLLLLLGISMRASLWEQAYRFGADDGQQPTLTAPPPLAPAVAPLVENARVAQGSLDDRESLRILLQAERAIDNYSSQAMTRPPQPDSDQTLASLNKSDDLIDARDVAFAARPSPPARTIKARPPVPSEVLQRKRARPF